MTRKIKEITENCKERL